MKFVEFTASFMRLTLKGFEIFLRVISAYTKNSCPSLSKTYERTVIPVTINELRAEVASLGFENKIEADNIFLTAANRALHTIFTERPVAKTVRIPISSHAPCSLIPIIKHRGGDEITIPLSEKYFSFRVSGLGTYTFNNGMWSESVSFNTEDSLIKGEVKASGATITFFGECYFTVYNLAQYKELSGDGTRSAPEYSPYIEIRVDGTADDFLFFLGEAYSKDGPIKDATLDGGIIRLPRGSYDEIYVTYARRPRRIKEGSGSEEVDVLAECAHLLPLLTAAYLWLEDSPEIAEYYMKLYQNEMGMIRRYRTSRHSNTYQDVVGWA